VGAGARRGRPIITLTTDFGQRDSYVAEMKAAVLGVIRDVVLVDITHEIAPYDITEGALALEAAAKVFPAGTVHVAVVDPGVGTERRALGVSARGQIFIGPDNGLFTSLLDGAGWQAYELRAAAARRPEVSSTFHGRDVFAPAAARVAAGWSLSRLGPRVADPVRLRWPEVRELAGTVAGAVVHVDRFGNLVTSIHTALLAALGRAAVVRVGGRRLPLVGTYGDLSPGAAGGVLGSRERLEIAVREGSAAIALRAGRGTPVLVTRDRFSRTTKERRTRR
jgi:S-adenosyl-L-methionine hydrolase (adenosine-forming)